ncbi:hypothetical protein [Streptomyces sp. LN549]|uniref:hypothetical protein n=1 Tax=Streptomyces sp. LN549 TaxID=3112979 RepID=UPI00371552D0
MGVFVDSHHAGRGDGRIRQRGDQPQQGVPADSHPEGILPAAGSHGQEARIRVSGTWDGRKVDTGGSLLAQGGEISVAVPGIGEHSYVWRVSLPQNAGFTAARSTPSGVDFGITGHQVVLGSSMYTR